MDQTRKSVGGKFNINGKIYTIYGGVNPIGRNREAVVNIKSLGVSQQHAIIILVDDDLHFISDLKSSNGTFLNSSKLVPLELYRLENGARIKFADIEGTYSKCTSNNTQQDNFSIISENTQNFTQTFYRNDTQIMDNTVSINQLNKTSDVKSLISTQELAEMADKLENSYIEAHEEPTQVVNTENITITAPQKEGESNINTCNIPSFDPHEEETQVIIMDHEINGEYSVPISDEEENNDALFNSVLDEHEAETQVIVLEINENETKEHNSLSKGETSHITLLDSHEDKTGGIIRDQALNEVIILNDIHKECPEKLPEVEEKTENSCKNSTASNLETRPSQLATKDILTLETSLEDSDSDVIRPMKKSVNIFESQDSTFEDLREDIQKSESNPGTKKIENSDSEDSESDIIRPLKKSVNIFESQDSTFEDLREDKQESELLPGTSSSKSENTHSEESESHIIRPLGKSTNVFESQESDLNEEGSNDSVDFLTMQRIPPTQKFLDSEIVKIYEEKEKISPNILKNNECDGSETDIDKGSVQIEDGSETESEEEVKKPPDNKTIKLSSNNSKADNDSDTDDLEEDITKNKKKILRKKRRNNVISDSDSETDKEETKSKKSQVRVVSTCSDSDNEKNLNITNSLKNSESNKNNESVGMILEESALEDDVKNLEKPEDPEKTVTNPSISRLSMAYNESLDDSDFIPSTQDSKPTSQTSKFDNSENSFKLGLTQLMEEDNTSQKNSSQGDSQINKATSQSEKKNSQDHNQKKFTFKKSTLGVTKSVDITLDLNEDIYQAKTQNICEDNSSKLNNSVDDHVFLQPTQEAPKKAKHNKEESIPDDEIYMLSTQKMDGSSNKTVVDDFYQQSTQKLSVDEIAEKNQSRLSGNGFYQLSTQKLKENEETNQVSEKNELRLSSNEFYQVPTQKLKEYEEANEVDTNNENDKPDYEDIFATQVMDTNDSPSKGLESELENMFATQRIVPAEDSLDKIQDIVKKKEIIDDKLPTEDKDLEAILATQKVLNSPKTSKEIEVGEENVLGKSVESQLEVIFASQISNLPEDKFVRPANPLVDILGKDTQDTEELLKKNWSPEKDKTTNENEENTAIKSKKISQIGLEQSFALLEAESFKIRRSGRHKNCEEVTVSCPKSRVSMVYVPSDKKISEEENKTTKSVRNARKRKPSDVIENSKITLRATRRKRKISEASNSSDEENEPTTSSGPSEQNIKNKISTKIEKESNEMIKLQSTVTERPATPSRNRSSRIKKKLTEEIIESIKNEYTSKKEDSNTNEEKSFRTRTKTNDAITGEKEKNETRAKSKASKSNQDDYGKTETEDIYKNKKTDTEERKSSRTRTSKIYPPEYGYEIEEKESMKTRNVLKSIEESGETSDNEKTDTEVKNRKRKTDADERKLSSRGKNHQVEERESVKTKKVLKSEESLDNEGDYKTVKTKSFKKLNDDLDKPMTPSRTSKRGATIQVTTPLKIRRVLETTPSCSKRIDLQDTPNRSKRKLKPKVVFTMMESPQLESQIKQLGGSVVDSVDTCTVLITKFVKRTMKLLSAVGLGKPICSEAWVQQSKKENNFLDPWDFILVDKEAEKKWNFSLKTSLERSSETKLFEGYTFQLLVTSAQDVLKGAIESCGGKIVARTPKGVDNFVVVASPDQKDKYKKLLKQQSNIIIVEPEAIFDGVLRQEIRFDRHLLK
ncbi:titin homolog [Harmonia axyridis]|uniref:titin homolog n=1 Tax=Harmonia axyridis TaxID=115357 RepID=UPI001E278DBD|nr:titin homolog [Harmonia axyridis]